MTTASPAAPSFTDGWNEAYSAPGCPRALYGPLLRSLERVDTGSLKTAVAERIQAAGATSGSEPLGVCPGPRLIEESEWTLLSEGLAQRVRARSAVNSSQNGGAKDTWVLP